MSGCHVCATRAAVADRADSEGILTPELSEVYRKMLAQARVGNDRSYIGVAVTRAAIEG